MPTEKAPLNILLTVDDDVRIDLELPLEEFPHSIPHQDDSGLQARWSEEAYDRTFAAMWRY